MAFTFNTRYKPKTTREYTKSDLTVYDSAAGNPNALTIYGKSEVVDGAIVSAGEGWATVDLGTLTWNYLSTGNTYFYASFPAAIKGIVPNDDTYKDVTLYTPRYQHKAFAHLTNKTITFFQDAIRIKDDDFTNSTDFKNSLNGVILTYQLADPTQGNTIAVKTDDGTGIGGEMATFSTGLPLYGIDGGGKDTAVLEGDNGKVVKRCAEIDLGTLEFVMPTSYINIFVANVPSAKFINNQSYSALCSEYTCNTDQSWQNISDKEFNIGQGIRQVNIPAIAIKDTDYNDSTAFTTAMSGVKLIYELATPTTTQFTATENASFAGLETYTPQTHITNNAGAEMKVNYTIKTPTI